MNIKIAAILIAIISFYTIVSTIRLFKIRKIGIREMIYWNAVWLLIGYFALFPKHIDIIVQLVDIHFRFKFVFIVTTLFLMIYILKISVTLSENQKKIVKLTQEIAITKHALSELIEK